MSRSHFWRSIGTICYVISGIFVITLAFQAVKARFVPDKQRPSAEEHSQSVVIMGVGSRFIAPTRIELQNIEGALNGAPTVFSRIPRVFEKRAATKSQAVTMQAEARMAPASEIQTEAQAALLPPSVTVAHTTKSRAGKRALVLVSSLLLTAIIATSFVFSVRTFSASLGQPAQANAAQSQNRQPQLMRPAFERGIIYPQWYSDGYGVNDTLWQQGVSTIKTQTDAQWIEIPVLFSQATSSSTTIQPSTSAPSTTRQTSCKSSF